MKCELPDDHVLITMTAEMRDQIHRLLVDNAKYPHSMFTTLTGGQSGTTQVMPLVTEIVDLFAPPYVAPPPIYKVVRQITYEGTLEQLASVEADLDPAPRTYHTLGENVQVSVAIIEDTRPQLPGCGEGPDLSLDPDSIARVD